MARYIDADALIEEIESLAVIVTGLRAGRGMLSEYAKLYKESILRIINEQPTAFDLDKVVQELKEHPNVFRPFGGDEPYIPLRDAIEVVKAGGIGSQWWNS